MTIQKLHDNMFKILIPFQNSPLGHLNTYLIRGERDLLVDTGFNNDACEEAMLSALCELEVKRSNLDIFITHSHSDHVGLTGRLIQAGTRVFCHHAGQSWHKRPTGSSFFEDLLKTWGLEGMPFPMSTQAEFDLGNTNWPDVRLLREGDMLCYGNYNFRFLETPGHMYDHGCLYEEALGWLLSGDMVLADITPSIMGLDIEQRNLHYYLQSLQKLEQLQVSTCFGGHRKAVIKPKQRIGQIVEHHQLRLEEISRISQGQWLNVMQVASRMHWNWQGGNWFGFAPMQKYFAMAEVMAHLAHLYQEGQAEVSMDKQVLLFKTTAENTRDSGAQFPQKYS